MRTLLAILFSVVLSASAQIPPNVMQELLVASIPKASTASFTPTDISGLVRWYDATSITGKIDYDRVSDWTDKTGNSNLTNVSTPNCPLYVSSNSIFGKPCVHFTQTNGPVPHWLSSVNLTNSSKTLFVVAYREGTASKALASFSDVNAILYNDAAGPWNYYNKSPGGANSAGSAQSNGVAIVKFAGVDSVSTRSQSGAWVTGNPNNNFTNAGQFVIAACPNSPLWMDCYVGEILKYDSALTDADVNKVGAYLASRWNFTWVDL